MSFLALVISLGMANPDFALIAEKDGEAPRVHLLHSESGEMEAIGPEAPAGRPVWSPDGSRLAFACRLQDGWRVCVFEVSSGKVRRLNHGQSDNRDPVWSLDGNRLAYTVGSGLDSQIAVYTLDEDRETVWAGARTSLMQAAWLPPKLTSLLLGDRRDSLLSGSSLASRGPVPEALIAIGLVGVPGETTTDLFLLTEHQAIAFPDGALPSRGEYEEWAPAASPDGLAFESNDGGDREIVAFTRRGATDISNHRTADWNPVWSPDGKWIAFESFRGGTRGIYRARRETGRVFSVAVDSRGACRRPTWSPDSKKIGYITDQEGRPALYIVSLRSGNQRRVTPATLTVAAPAWRPAR